MGRSKQIKRVRVASNQYLMRRISSVEEFEDQVGALVRTAAEDYDCHLCVFPEYFTAQLLSVKRLKRSRAPIPAQIRELAEYGERFRQFMSGLARHYKLHIVAGTIPEVERDRVYNHSYLFNPQGEYASQGKLHMTRFENEEWHVSPRRKLKVFDTALGRLAINICYDVEFPEVARAAARAGVQILVVPSCTDDRKGYQRVRYCAHARAIENQLYVVLSHTVGSIPTVPTISLNYGQSAILTPSDVMFSRDGIVAEGNVNEESVVIGELDLGLIQRSRTFGTVLPLKDSEHTAKMVKKLEPVDLLPKRRQAPGEVVIRQTTPADFPGIRELGKLIYPNDATYSDEYLQPHLDAFPEGQFVAVDVDTQQVLGMATTLIVDWDDYELNATWREITGDGRLSTHDPQGRTLYGADVMVHPEARGRGIGRRLYTHRRDLAIRLKMLRIRAGARMPGYREYAGRLTPEEYALKVVQGELRDPTLSFQLRRGFHVIAVVRDYLYDDPESQNHAAVIEWINHRCAKRRHYQARDPRFQKHVPQPPPEVTRRSAGS